MNININRVKIIVTIPEENTKEVQDAIFKSGAGIIGNYTNCSMKTKCIGTFKPNDKACPYIGKNNEVEYATEDKLEVVCNFDNVASTIAAIRKSHPYEEPAIDIIPLIDEDLFNI